MWRISDMWRILDFLLYPIWGSGGFLRTDPFLPAQPARSTYSAIQSDSTQESGKPLFPCLNHIASASIQGRGLL